MTQIQDLEKMLAADKNATIGVYALKSFKGSETGLPELLSGEIIQKRVYVMMRVMFWGKGKNYGQRKKTLTSAKFVFAADYDPGASASQSLPLRIDENTLSDPTLIKQLEEAGFVRKSEPSEPAQPMTDEEMIAYLKTKGAISGKVKLLENEPTNPLDGQ